MGELRVRSSIQRQGEISYVVHPRFWGQGIATEIGRQLLAEGFGDLGLHRIYATCDPRNHGSSRVLVKLGMTPEGRMRHTQWIRDGWRDSLIFSILEDEWFSAVRSTAPTE
jgi:RimJ/RimL family protein N-acetyltransferase